MNDITKTYTNGEIIIVWKPAMCIHSTICWKGESGLMNVFNPRDRPRIKPQAATTNEIINQINKCPSGALNFYKNSEANSPEEIEGESIVEVSPKGPLLV